MGLHFTWIRDLGHMIDAGTTIRVTCTRCHATRDLETADLAALAAKVGREYSLINRRCRCRLTDGCEGWNWFHYCAGVYRPMSDPGHREGWR